MGAKGKHSRSNSNQNREQKKKKHKHDSKSRSQSAKKDKKKKKNKDTIKKDRSSSRQKGEKKHATKNQLSSDSSLEAKSDIKLIQSSTAQQLQQVQIPAVQQQLQQVILPTSTPQVVAVTAEKEKEKVSKRKKSKSKKRSRSRSKDRKKRHYQSSNSKSSSKSRHRSKSRHKSKSREKRYVYNENQLSQQQSGNANNNSNNNNTNSNNNSASTTLQNQMNEQEQEKIKKMKMRLIKARALRFEKDLDDKGGDQSNNKGDSQQQPNAGNSGNNNTGFKLDITQVLTIYQQQPSTSQQQQGQQSQQNALQSGGLLNNSGMNQMLIGNQQQNPNMQFQQMGLGGNAGSGALMPPFMNLNKKNEDQQQQQQQLEEEKANEKRKPVFVDSDGLEDNDDEDEEQQQQEAQKKIGAKIIDNSINKLQQQLQLEALTAVNKLGSNNTKIALEQLSNPAKTAASSSSNAVVSSSQSSATATAPQMYLPTTGDKNQNSNNNVKFIYHRNSTQKVEDDVVVSEEDDPLEAFMKDIKKDAVQQEGFSGGILVSNKNQDQNENAQIEGEAEAMDAEDASGVEKYDETKIITLEEILGKKTKVAAEQEDIVDENGESQQQGADENTFQMEDTQQQQQKQSDFLPPLPKSVNKKAQPAVTSQAMDTEEIHDEEEETKEKADQNEDDNADEDDDDIYYLQFKEQMKQLKSQNIQSQQAEEEMQLQQSANESALIREKQLQKEAEAQNEQSSAAQQKEISEDIVNPKPVVDNRGGFIMDEEEEDEENMHADHHKRKSLKGNNSTNNSKNAAQSSSTSSSTAVGGNSNNNSNNNNKAKKEDEDPDDYFTKQKKMTEKKELKPVDHLQMNYKPFRREFYIECPEIRDMTQTQVDEYRKQLGDITVRGNNVPKPVKNWWQCGLSDSILNILVKKKKFLSPFPIQCQALPVIMKGRDTIGIAETGSGKTLAYILPMLRHVINQPRLEDGDGPIALIMVPTRELAHQINDDCRPFAKALGLNVVRVYGGAGIGGQLSELKKGAEIVVGTPGRLIDLLTTSGGKIMNLRRVTFVVLDEADRMLDQGFEPQISKILQNVRPDRQTVMFSATFPKNVEALAKKILLNKPVEVVVGARGQACTNIEQIVEVVEESQKLFRLLQILGEWNDKGSILVFVDRQTDADELFRELLKYGYWALVLHGGMDATDREFTIYDFKKGVANIMVATSVCARGLDIKSIVLVVNFSCPNHLEDYVHRIGRTGRAGNSGTALTFITKEQDMYAQDIVKALYMSNQKPSQTLLDMVADFKKKVETGEAKLYYNRNLQGSGYKFDETEYRQARETRKAIRKRFGMELNLSDGENSEEEDIFVKKERRGQPQGGQVPGAENSSNTSQQQQQQQSGNASSSQSTTQPASSNNNNNTAGQNPRELTEREKLNMIKDPTVRNQIMQEGYRAAIQALTGGGKTQEQVLEAASAAIKKALEKYKPAIKSVDQGIMEASQLIETFQRREEENMEIVTYDFEINDYPANARQKVMNKEFLNSIHDLTNCNVTTRGQHFELNKKVPPGQKKLYLHIEGDSKYYVTSAYREIKRVIEEAAMKNLTIGGAQPGRFKL